MRWRNFIQLHMEYNTRRKNSFWNMFTWILWISFQILYEIWPCCCLESSVLSLFKYYSFFFLFFFFFPSFYVSFVLSIKEYTNTQPTLKIPHLHTLLLLVRLQLLQLLLQAKHLQLPTKEIATVFFFFFFFLLFFFSFFFLLFIFCIFFLSFLIFSFCFFLQ